MAAQSMSDADDADDVITRPTGLGKNSVSAAISLMDLTVILTMATTIKKSSEPTFPP